MTAYNWRDKCKSEFCEATDKDLDQAETKLGKRIPKDLREFIKKHNQTVFLDFPSVSVKRKDGADGSYSDSVSLAQIYGVPTSAEEEKQPSIMDEQFGYGFENCVPERFLAIGRPIQHAIVCISTEGDDEGAVYLFEPDVIGEIEEVRSMEYMYPLAPSFGEFLASLKQPN